MSEWEEHDLEAIILAILRSFQYEPPHHFGRPFVSAYQIAIALAKHYPGTFEAVGRPIGGSGNGTDGNSLAWYIATQLSHRLNGNNPPPIEGAWFDRAYVEDIRFKDQSGIISASNPAALSLFRLRDD
jgi:hypothetical protein